MIVLNAFSMLCSICWLVEDDWTGSVAYVYLKLSLVLLLNLKSLSVVRYLRWEDLCLSRCGVTLLLPSPPTAVQTPLDVHVELLPPRFDHPPGFWPGVIFASPGLRLNDNDTKDGWIVQQVNQLR